MTKPTVVPKCRMCGERHQVERDCYGKRKAAVFVACDDGSRICVSCLGPIDGALNQYGPVRKVGRCYTCGFEKVEVRR